VRINYTRPRIWRGIRLKLESIPPVTSILPTRFRGPLRAVERYRCWFVDSTPRRRGADATKRLIMRLTRIMTIVPVLQQIDLAGIRL